ncbi:uncharacterized protein LOC130625979 [Hydractinia symbiolongicarpus]|uniref:uncharacterized protein LOC130625979 n=1 Tax=Hydractinia symbiolongicarpus TaxID=13093 RepID=UPI00254A49F9|nr:uncharacterized protein LOC130625979 [Hydractinia symbiolongicarpus]XP_057297083.1 uncharacterized protein LOC130625979 [Hydractinia symbiolongicarpus]
MVDLTVSVSPITTNMTVGAKDYNASSTIALADQLKLDIVGLSLEYCKKIAEDALNSEKNEEITYNFCCRQNFAMLYYFEITTSTKAYNKVNVTWKAVEASVTFPAQGKICTTKEKVTRFLGIVLDVSRSQHKHLENRGLTTEEIGIIQAELTKHAKSAANRNTTN